MPDAEFDKIRAKFRQRHLRLQRKMYSRGISKAEQHETSLKVIRTMTEENTELGKIGYWFDDTIEKWTNRKRTPSELEAVRKEADLMEKAFAGDSKAALELLKMQTKTETSQPHPKVG